MKNLKLSPKEKEIYGEFFIFDIINKFSGKKIIKVCSHNIWNNSELIAALNAAGAMYLYSGTGSKDNKDLIYFVDEDIKNYMLIFTEFGAKVDSSEDISKSILYSKLDDNLLSVLKNEKVIKYPEAELAIFLYKYVNLTKDVVLDKFTELGRESLSESDIKIMNDEDVDCYISLPVE